MAIWYGLRSAMFYLGYWPLVLVFSTLGLVIGFAIPYRPLQTLLTTANVLIVWWLRITCGVKWRIEGAEHLPATPFVALSKHQSPWETFYLQRALRPVSTLLKKELLKIPFFGWGLRLTRPIAIDRGNPREAIRQVLVQGRQRLREGNNVLIFPEGTRIDVGQVGNYGRSGAALAVAAEAPLILIAHNAGVCWPARKFIKYPGTVRMVIHPPIATADADSKQLTEDAKNWIEAKLREF